MFLTRVIVDDEVLNQNPPVSETSPNRKHVPELTVEDYLKKARILRSETAWNLFRLHKSFDLSQTQS